MTNVRRNLFRLVGYHCETPKHTLVIKGNGTTGPSATMIDARELNDRILQMLPGTTVVLENLILTGGEASDDGQQGTGTARGGAILDDGNSLTLDNVWVVANKAQGTTDMDAQGGGIYSAGGTLAVYGSLIAMNTAAGGFGSSGTGANGGNAQGGGLYAAGGTVILGSLTNPDKIESNRATGGIGGSGATGGVGGSGGNGQGGGIYLGAGSLTMSHVKMPDNYLYLGLITAMFPQAKIIHCCRDFRDTVRRPSRAGFITKNP